MKEKNPSQYIEIDSAYIASIPSGGTFGPAPKEFKPWAEMDYGNFLINTYERVRLYAAPRERSSGPSPLPDENYNNANFAYKGIALRLNKGDGGIAAGNAWMMFDHDPMRVAGAWTGEGFIDWEAILFNGRHNISPGTFGELHFENKVEPGWANPKIGSFEDSRFLARDKRRFGPLPKDWAHYQGLYQYGERVILFYTVGNAKALETFGLESLDNSPVFSRTLNISPSEMKLKVRIAPRGMAVSMVGDGAVLKEELGHWVLEVQPSISAKLKLLIGKSGTKGGASRYPLRLKTTILMGESSGPFQVDVMNPPFDSPWKNQFRMSGIDFFKDTNEGVVCTTDGDVWHVKGFIDKSGALSWQRIASGLFQPLGIKVINGSFSLLAGINLSVCMI